MTTPECVIRPATREDYVRFFGHPPEQTFRGLVGEAGGELVGIGGISLTRLPTGGMAPQAFMSLQLDMEKTYRRELISAAKQVRGWLKEYPVVYAVADAEYPSSPRFLEHMGFEYHRLSDGLEVYRWRG